MTLAALLLLVAQEGAGDVELRTIPARTDAPDTLEYASPQTNLVLEDAIVQASPRTAIAFFDGRGPHRGTVLRNLRIVVEPGTLRLDRSYWGVRGYDMANTVLDRVEVTGFGRVTEKHDEGHALYMNLAGDLALVDSFVHHNGGQGLQAVNRPSESVLPPGPAPGTLLIRRTRFVENGFNPDRGAFQVSIFGTGQDVLLEEVAIVAGHERALWEGVGSRGALLVEPEAWAPERGKRPWWRPAEVDGDFEVPFTQGRVELRAVRVDHVAPDRPIVQIKGCRELVVTGCEFAGGPDVRIELDLPGKPGRDSGRIEWTGNRGDASVNVRGRRVGAASDDFVLE